MGKVWTFSGGSNLAFAKITKTDSKTMNANGFLQISSSGFEISLTPTVSDTPPAVSSTQAWQPPSDGIPELQEHWARLENVQHSIADLTNVTESLSIEHCRVCCVS